MEQKKELISLIEAIECEKALQYLLDFTKAFVKHYMYYKDCKWIK